MGEKSQIIWSFTQTIFKLLSLWCDREGSGASLLNTRPVRPVSESLQPLFRSNVEIGCGRLKNYDANFRKACFAHCLDCDTQGGLAWKSNIEPGSYYSDNNYLESVWMSGAVEILARKHPVDPSERLLERRVSQKCLDCVNDPLLRKNSR